MGSNVAFASRAVLSKLTMNEPVGKNMDAANLYGILTIMAFILTFPVAFYMEGGALASTWAASTAVVGTPWLVKNIIINGLYYYLYNEVAFLTLNQVAPITHSIANTVKRVAIIVATCIVFHRRGGHLPLLVRQAEVALSPSRGRCALLAGQRSAQHIETPNLRACKTRNVSVKSLHARLCLFFLPFLVKFVM